MQLLMHFSKEEGAAVLKDLGAVTKHYQKDETVLHAGRENRYIFSVLSGSVQIQNSDIWGNTSVLNMVEKGQVFAEAYAFLPGEKLLVEAVANEPCEVLVIDAQRIFALPESDIKNKLIQNLLFISSVKNVQLSRRILHTSSKRVRERVLSFLSEQAERQESRYITIPYDRRQMADYLSVERSALSKELSKMKAEGLIDYHKNTFKILI